jgi:tetratricopeptide (TPR) repeat protein
MGLFGKLFGKTSDIIEDPIALRTELFTAANAGNKARVHTLCKANRQRIAENFPAWRVITSYPGVNAEDTAKIQYITNGMTMVAETFRDALADPSLWEHFTDSSPNSPAARFEKTMAEARKLSAENRYRETSDLLNAYLDEIKTLEGPVADHFRSDAYGIAGAADFQDGRVADAIPHFEHALDICIRLNEPQGTFAYSSNLYESHRYLGQTEEAARYADRIATILGEAPDAQRWRDRAARVRAGEPLVRVLVQQGEQRLEVDEVTRLEGITQYLFERNRTTIARATAMIGQANALADAGKYDESLQLYQDAASIDPYNPDPHYQAGKTLSLLRRYEESAAAYENAVHLGPGFYNVSSNLWLARQLHSGRIPHEAFVAIWVTENSGIDANQQLALVEEALKQAPHVPQLHMEKAKIHLALQQPEMATPALEAGLACECDPDMRSRLLAQLGMISQPGQRRHLWEEVMQIPDANLAARAVAQIHLRLENP